MFLLKQLKRKVHVVWDYLSRAVVENLPIALQGSCWL
jgi:hypothetical protein